MVHYALFLQAFSHTIKYRNAKNHGNADALSRLPLAVDKNCEYLTDADVTNISQVKAGFLSFFFSPEAERSKITLVFWPYANFGRSSAEVSRHFEASVTPIG